MRGGHYAGAATLYEAGAKQGDPVAARKLGNLYDLRPGVQEDHEKAVYWYRKAIELGDVPSYWFVGVIYRDGKGNVPKDDGQAEYYFLQGAERGQHYSMYDLSNMYADRRTKEQNDVEGLKWLEVVTTLATNCPTSNEGCQYILRDPKGVRGKLMARMNPDQRQKAKTLADDWISNWRQKSK